MPARYAANLHKGAFADARRARYDPAMETVRSGARPLATAASYGPSTAHIARPHEHGPGGGETVPSVPASYAVRDLTDLADQLGC